MSTRARHAPYRVIIHHLHDSDPVAHQRVTAAPVSLSQVETELLLYDALHPDAPLLQPSSLRTHTRPNHAPLQPSAALLSALEERAEALPMETMAAEAEAVDAASIAAAAGASANVTLASISASSAQTPQAGVSDAGDGVPCELGGAEMKEGAAAVHESASDMDLDLTGGLKLESRMEPETKKGLSASIPVAATRSVAGTSGAGVLRTSEPTQITESLETSGLRAATMLPACYTLLEASIEALAEDSALDVEPDIADLQMDSESDLESEDGLGSRRKHALGPVLGAEEARRLMPALGRSVESLLQFVETVAQQVRKQHRQHRPQPQEQQSTPSGPEAVPPFQARMGTKAGVEEADDESDLVEGVTPASGLTHPHPQLPPLHRARPAPFSRC